MLFLAGSSGSASVHQDIVRRTQAYKGWDNVTDRPSFVYNAFRGVSLT